MLASIWDEVTLKGERTSVSCQFSDIRLHSQLSNEQKQCISKQTRLWLVHIKASMFIHAKSSTIKALATRERLRPQLSLLINIKWTGSIGWLLCWYRWIPLLSNINEMAPKVNCFADFCHQGPFLSAIKWSNDQGKILPIKNLDPGCWWFYRRYECDCPL